jgi:glycosyltransferase involved in cell wall biosynthesis
MSADTSPLDTQSNDRGKVAIVIPCFRVKAHILDVLARIGPECHKVYVVDDCCPEGTGSHVKEHCSDARVTVLQTPQNQGVGGAMILGFQQAIVDGWTVVVKIDGDGQMDPRHIERFIQPILQGEADYTKGNRFYSLEMLTGMPTVRLLGNAALSFMSKLSTGYWNIFDPTNGFTAIHVRTLAVLPLDKISRRYFFESDMLFRLNISRAVVADIPMFSIYANEKSNLKIHQVFNVFLFRHITNTLKRFFYCYILRDFSAASVYLLFGTALFLFGTIFGSVQWWELASAGKIATPGTVMLAGLPVILGLQLLIGFLASDMSNVPTRPLHKSLVAPAPLRDR